MTALPFISVVMSVYNAAQYVASSLASVLAQGGVGLEIVVVDDGSTDRTGSILESIAGKEPRIRVIRQENMGLTRALARGCLEARGDLIARQDADDVSMPARLQQQARVLAERPEVALVGSWVETIGPADEPLEVIRYPEGGERGRQTVVEEMRNPAHGSTMFRRGDYASAGGYRPQFYFAQDTDLWLRLAERGRIVFLPEVLYRLRIVDGSITTRHREEQQALYELARACCDARATGRPEQPILARAEAIRPAKAGGGSVRRGAGSYFIGRTLIRNRDPRALKYMQSYVRQVPLDPKGWVGVLQAALIRKGDESGPPSRRQESS